MIFERKFLVMSVMIAAVALSACDRLRDPDAVVAAAKEKIALGQPAEAMISLKNLVQKSPNNVAARVLLAQIALDQGDVQTADTELGRLKRDDLKDAASQMMRLRIDLAKGRASEVLEQVKSGKLALSPMQSDLMRAGAMRASGDLAGSEAIYRRLALASPQAVEPALELISTLLAEGRAGEAVGEADLLLSHNPKDPDANAMRAQIDLRLGRPESAIRGFSTALSSAPLGWAASRRWSTMFSLADAQLRSGQVAAAKATYQGLDKQAPGLVGTRLLAAKLALAENRAGDALVELQRIALAVPNDEYVQLLLAEALIRTRSREQALTTLERLVRVAPRNIDARKGLARMLLEQNRPDKVVDLLTDLPADGEMDAEAQALLDRAKAQASRASQSVDVLIASLAKDPENTNLKLQLAAAQMASGSPSRAMDVLATIPTGTEVAARTRMRLLALIAQSNRKDLERSVDQMVGDREPDLEALLAAAGVVQSAGRSDLADRLLDKALQLQPDNKNVLMARAASRFIDRKWAEASVVLDKLLKIDPNNAAALVAQARVADASGNSEAAQRWLGQALKADPAAIDPALLQAGLDLRQSKLPAALSVLDALVVAAAKDGRAAAAAAGLLANGRHIPEALRFMQISVQQKVSATSLQSLAALQIASNQKDAARKSLLQAISLEPNSIPANLSLAAVDIESGQANEALARMKDLVARNPTRADVHGMQGEALVGLKRYAEAAQSFQQAYSLIPTAKVAVRLYQIRVLAQMPLPEKALQDWLQRSPRDTEVREMLGSHFMRSGSRSAAIIEYETIVKERPNDALALNNLAWMLLTENPQRAEDLARRALAISPDVPQIADTLGWVLYKNGKLPAAATNLKFAVDKVPADGSVRYRYAVVLGAMGNSAEARQQLAKALAGAAFPERAQAEKLAAELR